MVDTIRHHHWNIWKTREALAGTILNRLQNIQEASFGVILCCLSNINENPSEPLPQNHKQVVIPSYLPLFPLLKHQLKHIKTWSMMVVFSFITPARPQ